MKLAIALWMVAGSLVGWQLQRPLEISPFLNSIAHTVNAQAGSLSGTILDPQARPVSNALVNISKRGDSPAKFSTVSDKDGRFRLSSVPMGDYEIQVSSPDPWLLDGTVSANIRPPESMSVDIRLPRDLECDEAEKYVVTTSDRSEIVNEMLREFLRTTPDPNLIIDKRVAISKEGLDSVPVSSPNDFQMTLLSPTEIQTKANLKGDFLYLRFKKFEIRGRCVAVELNKLWADGTSTIETGPRTLLGETMVYYVFHKRSGKWVGKFLTGSIT